MSDLRATNFKGRTSGSVPNMPDGVVVGSAVTISSSGIDVGAAGIITATTFSGTVSSSTGSFSGDVDIADKIVHTGDTDTAIRFPAANTFTVETGGSERIRVDSNGRLGIGTDSPSSLLHLLGSAPKINLQHTATGSQGVLRWVDITGTVKSQIASYLNVADSGNIEFCAGGESTVMELDSSGRLLLGTTTEGQANADDLTVANTSGHAGITIRSGTTNNGSVFFSDGTSGNDEFRGYVQYNHDNNRLVFGTNAAEVARIDSDGNMMIGVSSPSTSDSRLTLQQTGDHCEFNIVAGTTHGSVVNMGDTDDYNDGRIKYDNNTRSLQFQTANAERLRIDSGGRLLLGNTSGFNGGILCVGSGQGTNSPSGEHIKIGPNADRIEFLDSSSNTSDTGSISLYNTVYNNRSADIELYHPAANTGGIKFSTHDGTSLGERMSIDNLGNVFMTTVSGGQEALTINRQQADGTLISFEQGGTFEGNIAVSGSTVSYNGGHLSRWSQTLTTDEHTDLLKGTVMTNLDEMCQWVLEARDEVLWTEEDTLPEGVSVGDVRFPARAAGFEDNEQLNKMAVSSVEGDPNVAGVMVNIDDDGDLNVAMTGDMVIRIAQGTTVARGDLLMSAGDGTAKPQGDDIVRSKTIAKVTSTTKSVTYSDGSYCVPCVLMAC